MTVKTKHCVTQNPERKLRKKLRNSKTVEEKEKWSQELETYLSRKKVNEKVRRQHNLKKRKITDDEAFQEAQKYNSSREAKERFLIAKEKKQKEMYTTVNNMISHEKAKQILDYQKDMKEEICIKKVKESKKIDKRVKELTEVKEDSPDHVPMSEKEANKKVNEELIQECHEIVIKKYKIRDIMRRNKVSKTEAEKMYEEEKVKEEDEAEEEQTRIEELEDKE
tara:strand:- start:560 stop:1228 length:669 start_codon:yes stop_codon:yes gene_type:complete